MWTRLLSFCHDTHTISLVRWLWTFCHSTLATSYRPFGDRKTDVKRYNLYFCPFVVIHSRQTMETDVLLASVVLSQYTHNWSSSVTARRTSFSRFVTKHLRFSLTAKRLWTWLQSFCHNTHTNGLIQFLQDVLTSAILSQYTHVGQMGQSFCRNTLC